MAGWTAAPTSRVLPFLSLASRLASWTFWYPLFSSFSRPSPWTLFCFVLTLRLFVWLLVLLMLVSVFVNSCFIFLYTFICVHYVQFVSCFPTCFRFPHTLCVFCPSILIFLPCATSLWMICSWLMLYYVMQICFPAVTLCFASPAFGS